MLLLLTLVLAPQAQARTFATTLEICDDGVDNDRDKRIDEDPCQRLVEQSLELGISALELSRQPGRGGAIQFTGSTSDANNILPPDLEFIVEIRPTETQPGVAVVTGGALPEGWLFFAESAEHAEAMFSGDAEPATGLFVGDTSREYSVVTAYGEEGTDIGVYDPERHLAWGVWAGDQTVAE